MSRCKTTTVEWSHMKNWDCIFNAISKATGTKFSGEQVTPISGDKVSDTQIISDGREEYFIKRATADAVRRLAAEVEGLEALRKVKALTVPRVIVSGLADTCSYIVLERLRFTRATGPSIGLPAPHYRRNLRLGSRQLHRSQYAVKPAPNRLGEILARLPTTAATGPRGVNCQWQSPSEIRRKAAGILRCFFQRLSTHSVTTARRPLGR